MGNFSKFTLAPNQRPRKMSRAYRALLKRKETAAVLSERDGRNRKAVTK